MAHFHSVVDDDLYFDIDPVSRTIEYQGDELPVISQGDHNSERFTFEIPRYVDGHDMSLCDLVQVHYINIDSNSSNRRNPGLYTVKDLQISPDDDNYLICTWLVSHNATKFEGSLNFILRFACTSGSKIEYSWNTTVYSSVAVVTSISNADIIVEQHADVLQEWYFELMSSGVMGVNSVVDARNKAIDMISKAEATKIQEAQDQAIANVNQAASTAAKDAEKTAIQNIMDAVQILSTTQNGETITAIKIGDDIFKAETWTFTLIDGTTVTKKVFALDLPSPGSTMRFTLDGVEYTFTIPGENNTWMDWMSINNDLWELYGFEEYDGIRGPCLVNRSNNKPFVDEFGNVCYSDGPVFSGVYTSVYDVIFTVDGEEYTVDGGTTWDYWCTYGEGGNRYYCGSGVYEIMDGTPVRNAKMVEVIADKPISSGAYYCLTEPDNVVTLYFSGKQYKTVIGITWDEFTQANSTYFYTKDDSPNGNNVTTRNKWFVYDTDTNAKVNYTDVIYKTSYGIQNF